MRFLHTTFIFTMTTIKVKYRPSTVPDKEGVIYYQIIHRRVQRQISTDYHIMKEEWSERRSAIVMPSESGRQSYIRAIHENVRWDIERINRIISKLENAFIEFYTNDIVEEFNRYSREYTLFVFTEKIIATLRIKGKHSTADNYRATLNSLKNYRADQDVMLDTIDREFVEGYESWLKAKGLCLNTISFYMRIFRAIYRRVVDADIITERNPFRHVYTGICKTVKRALPLKVIRKIKTMDLTFDPQLDHARRMFLMSFYLRGMSFIDMAYLKKSNLQNGFITYNRRKTGQLLTVAWTKEMQAILDCYPTTAGEYMFPIIPYYSINHRASYKSACFRINRNLKKIGQMIGSSTPLTMYAARHSWASLAKSHGVPIGVISEAMGHDNESTTRIYLASLETSVVDKANERIISLL